MSGFTMFRPDDVQHSRYLSELVEKMKGRGLDAEIDYATNDCEDFEMEYYPYGTLFVAICPCATFEEAPQKESARVENSAYEYAMKMF